MTGDPDLERIRAEVRRRRGATSQLPIPVAPPSTDLLPRSPAKTADSLVRRLEAARQAAPSPPVPPAPPTWWDTYLDKWSASLGTIGYAFLTVIGAFVVCLLSDELHDYALAKGDYNGSAWPVLETIGYGGAIGSVGVIGIALLVIALHLLARLWPVLVVAGVVALVVLGSAEHKRQERIDADAAEKREAVKAAADKQEAARLRRLVAETRLIGEVRSITGRATLCDSSAAKPAAAIGSVKCTVPSGDKVYYHVFASRKEVLGWYQSFTLDDFYNADDGCESHDQPWNYRGSAYLTRGRMSIRRNSSGAYVLWTYDYKNIGAIASTNITYAAGLCNLWHKAA